VRDAWKLLDSAFQQQWHSPVILDIGRVHLGSKNEGAGIDVDVCGVCDH
jgi:hypothetical protein